MTKKNQIECTANSFSENVFLYYLLKSGKAARVSGVEPDVARFLAHYQEMKTDLEHHLRDQIRTKR